MQPLTCQGCPLYGIGKGFVLGTGNPVTAKIALQLEAPGSEEIVYRVDDQEEIERRERDYPQLPLEYLTKGAPVVGRAGSILFGWGLAPVQLTRKDLFIDNTLRCLPPKEKGKEPYPKGAVRKKAEAFCRQYDRWEQFNPTVSLVQIHPAAIARVPTPLPYMIKTFEKAKHFSLGSERPIVLCGGKSVGQWMGHGSTVQTWLGHYEMETEYSRKARDTRREEGLKVSTVKEKKKKKLTVRAALMILLASAQPELIGSEGEVGQRINYLLTESEYKEMLGLTEVKSRKKGESK